MVFEQKKVRLIGLGAMTFGVQGDITEVGKDATSFQELIARVCILEDFKHKRETFF